MKISTSFPVFLLAFTKLNEQPKKIEITLPTTLEGLSDEVICELVFKYGQSDFAVKTLEHRSLCAGDVVLINGEYWMIGTMGAFKDGSNIPEYSVDSGIINDINFNCGNSFLYEHFPLLVEKIKAGQLV